MDSINELLPWRDPLEAARHCAASSECYALLYSGQRTAYTGRYSWLGLYPQEVLSGGDFQSLASCLRNDCKTHEQSWFGYIGYEMLHQLETHKVETQSHIALPALWFARFGLILRFDHETREVICHRLASLPPPSWEVAALRAAEAPAIAFLASSMSRADYLALVADTREAIAAGRFCQANITRKFTGRFAATPDSFALFTRLCAASPAAYSAFIRMGDAAILSSSPERFLTIDPAGRMESRPIKGTAPRFADPARDAESRAQLAASEKDRAENLMIVDLMRNDLAQSSIPGSVTVEQLFEVASYATLHHMASTVRAVKRGDVTTLEAVKHAFPPGSMTGAPKHSAVEWCLSHEGIKRGVYSGALGWFGGDGSCDLSVVIRTLVIEQDRFEFQVGGAIVADSEPEKEWEETMTKARGIMSALGLELSHIERL